MAYQHTRLVDGTTYTTAPWCYLTERGIWHDFRGDYNTDAEIVALFGADLSKPTNFKFDYWLREGYIVPMQEQHRNA